MPVARVKWSVASWLVGKNGANTISCARSAVSQLRSCEEENEEREWALKETNNMRLSLWAACRWAGILR